MLSRAKPAAETERITGRVHLSLVVQESLGNEVRRVMFTVRCVVRDSPDIREDNRALRNEVALVYIIFRGAPRDTLSTELDTMPA